jgi:hypothetical protein
MHALDGQAAPQVPQWSRSVSSSTSQPLRAFPSQSPKPEAHTMEQLPPEHEGAPPAPLQTMPQPPQWLALVLVSTSQPSPVTPLQSAIGAVHRAPDMHVEPTQKAVRPAGARHTFRQLPQLRTSAAVLVSQPSDGSLLQSAKPALQAPIAHTPAAQDVAALTNRQRRPHAPQLSRSAAVPVSQPGAAVQSPKPGRHTVWVQRLIAHAVKALAKLVSQLTPHAPQWSGSIVGSTHPAPAQKILPAGQLQRPSAQACPRGHAEPHAPQWLALAFRLVHPEPPQYAWPAGHTGASNASTDASGRSATMGMSG